MDGGGGDDDDDDDGDENVSSSPSPGFGGDDEEAKGRRPDIAYPLSPHLRFRLHPDGTFSPSIP